MQRLFIITLSLICAGCGSTGINLYPYTDAGATREQFRLCHGQGCTERTWAGFTDSEWKKITSIFKPSPKSPKIERERIAKAIALMEHISGKKTGTAADKGEAKAPKSDKYQMDCIDETVNTNLYLNLLSEVGLLKYHTPARHIHRGYFVDGTWPHNTATIKEIKSGTVYVVDAFYFDNGQKPSILPASEWLAGWRP
jgi:hypothetical protein